MSEVQAMVNAETLVQTIAGMNNTAGKSGLKATSKSESGESIKKGFQDMLDELGLGKEQLANLNQQPDLMAAIENLMYGNMNEDNSMCNDSNLNDITGKVGTLEGFELLSYQTDKNVTQRPEMPVEMLNATMTNVSEMTQDMQNNQVNEQMLASFLNGVMNGGEQNGSMSEQLAGMQNNAPNAASQTPTQQEVLEKVGMYLCSLASTNESTVKQVDQGTQTGGESLMQSAASQNTPMDASLQEGMAINGEEADNTPNGVKAPLDAFANAVNLENAPNIQQNEATQMAEVEVGFTQDVNGEEIISKESILNIVDKVQTNLSEGRQDMEIQLKPEYLGKLSIRLMMENGALRVNIKTADATVRGMISDQLPTLQSAMQDKGIEVSNVDVYFDNQTLTQDQRQMNEQHNNQGKHNRWQSENISDVSGVSAAYDAVFGLTDIQNDMGSVVYLA